MDIGCSICQETFIASAQCDITNCGHLFHRLCIAGWLQYSKTCPTCRNATTKAKLKRVYFTNQMSDQTVRVDELLKDLVGAGEREVRLRAEILSLTAALAQANQRIATLECTNGPVARNEVNPSVQNRSHGDYLYSGPFAPHLEHSDDTFETTDSEMGGQSSYDFVSPSRSVISSDDCLGFESDFRTDDSRSSSYSDVY